MFVAILYGWPLVFAIGTAHAADPAPHIALILPLASASFGRHADAVRQGFFAAAKADGKTPPPIRVYPVNEDSLNVLDVYDQALEAGASLVVGPLTRDGVAALASSKLVTVPTLALNTLEPGLPQPARLYLFSLNVEQEARQIAQLASSEGRRNALLIGDESLISKRMRQAFIEEFARRGGTAVAELAYSADQRALRKLRQAAELGVADMVFLALDAGRARTVRPYLGNALALYATSQVNAGAGPLLAFDLAQVRFVDMPWLLQPDHAAVMIYPRVNFGDTTDLERLYALGIDAFRIGIELLNDVTDIAIDGVTGQIRMGADQQFTRDLTAAQFTDGKIAILRTQ